MEIPTNQSGFVSNRSESELQSQAPAPPVGRAEQEAGAASVIPLSDGESRKRGLGLRVRIPIIKRARGVKDPGWISKITFFDIGRYIGPYFFVFVFVLSLSVFDFATTWRQCGASQKIIKGQHL